MTSPLAYLNGRFLPFADAALPLHDAGFVSGATVVDNARTFRHTLFRWGDHLARFRRDCESCYVPLDATDEQLTAAAEDLVSRNARSLPPGGELQLVTFATPGPLGVYLGEPANGPPTLGMVTYPLPFARYRPFFTAGVTLAVAGFQAGDVADILPPGVKHRSRLFWHVADRRVRDPHCGFYRPGAVPVVVTHGGAGDTAVGSILVVAGRTIYRPEFGTVQDGISSRVAGELATALGYEFVPAPLDVRRLTRPPEPGEPDPAVARASEVLLVGTGFCVAGVREFAAGRQSRRFDWPGPVYRALLAAWSDLVGVDVEGQFTAAGPAASG